MIVESVGNLEVSTGRTDLDFIWNILASLVSPLLVIIGRFFKFTIAVIMTTFVNLVLYVPHYQLLIKKMVKVSLKEYTLAFF